MIVGLGHQARVGKDSTADVLCNVYGFKRLSFANRLKAMALRVDPVVTKDGKRLSHAVHRYGWDRAKERFPEIRVFLQHLGVAVRELIHTDIWANPVVDEIMEHPNHDYVITDLRFTNEARALKRLSSIGFNVKLVQIVRPGIEPANAHVSEHDLDGWPWDYVLHNDGTLDDLELRVKSMLVEVGGLDALVEA